MGGACALVGRGSGWGLCVGREGQWVGLVLGRGSGWGLCVSWERQWVGLVCW